jgi:hypothetical protein
MGRRARRRLIEPVWPRVGAISRRHQVVILATFQEQNLVRLDWQNRLDPAEQVGKWIMFWEGQSRKRPERAKRDGLSEKTRINQEDMKSGGQTTRVISRPLSRSTRL